MTINAKTARLWPDLSATERASAVLAGLRPRERVVVDELLERRAREAQAGAASVIIPIARAVFARDLAPEQAIRRARHVINEWVVPESSDPR